MKQQAQRADPLHAVEIIGIVMGHLVHYFPRPIGTVAAPVMPREAYALQVAIPPHASIESGAFLIVDRKPAESKEPYGLTEFEGAFYAARSGKIGRISWYRHPPANAHRVIWIRMP